MPDKLRKADVFIFISSCAVFVDHILQGKQILLIICYMLYSQLAGPDGSLDPAMTRNSEVLGSNPGRVRCLSLWFCIYNYPNCAKPWNVQCCLWYYVLYYVKTHHYIIFFVRPRHSKPGMESYCSSSAY